MAHLENGTPEHVVMAMVGHVSRQMLEHYSCQRMRAKQEAVNRVQVGFGLGTSETAESVQ